MFKKTCLTLAVLALGGCRIVSQQELADLKSPPNPHMANMDKTRQQSIVPQVVTKARPAAELMSALKAAKDIDSACKTLGYRAQDENPCIFYVKVSGTVSKLDTASRSGKMTLTDASVGKVTVQIGPTLRGTQLRDGYSGASYQDFNDRCAVRRVQQEYQQSGGQNDSDSQRQNRRQRGGVRRLLGLGIFHKLSRKLPRRKSFMQGGQ